MTTLISLATRDSIVIGCDSLATVSQPMIEPRKLRDHFFDKDGNLLNDASGVPLLKKADQLRAFTQKVPKNQLPNVTKIYPLEPIHAGALFSGISGIGDKTIRNLVESFLGSDAFRNLHDHGRAYTLKEVGEELMKQMVVGYFEITAHCA